MRLSCLGAILLISACASSSPAASGIQEAVYRTSEGRFVEFEFEPNSISGVRSGDEAYSLNSGIAFLKKNNVRCFGFPNSSCFLAYEENCARLLLQGPFEELSATCLRLKSSRTELSETIILIDDPEAQKDDINSYMLTFDAFGNLTTITESSRTGNYLDIYFLVSGSLNLPTLARELKIFDMDVR